MPLIEPERAPSPHKIRPLPTLGASLLATTLFVVAIAVIARLTAEGSVMPPPPGGFVVPPVIVDAGSPIVEEPDAGVMVTVSMDAGVDVPTGPPSVQEPPFSAAEVAAAAVVVVERCALEALRWDPSLGGPFSLRIELPVREASSIEIDGLTSPVLSSCIGRRTPEMTLPPAFQAAALEVPLAVAARASLDAAGRVTWSDAVVVSGRRL